MVNGMSTANRRVASDARGSQKCESGDSDPVSRAKSYRDQPQPELHIPADVRCRVDPWEASDWPSSKKSHSAVAFLFLATFSALFPLIWPDSNPFTLTSGTKLSNSTCSRTAYLCIIGFAYRAAEARSRSESSSPQFSRVNRVFLPRRTCWPK
jgi:hypothetical protein